MHLDRKLNCMDLEYDFKQTALYSFEDTRRISKTVLGVTSLSVPVFYTITSPFSSRSLLGYLNPSFWGFLCEVISNMSH